LVSACVLIRTRRGEFDEVVKRIIQLPGVNRVFPVLGRYDVVADLEAPDFISLGKTVLRMSMMAGVVFTETMLEILQEEA
jgi:uncharacterized protein with GYD domain